MDSKLHEAVASAVAAWSRFLSVPIWRGEVVRLWWAYCIESGGLPHLPIDDEWLRENSPAALNGLAASRASSLAFIVASTHVGELVVTVDPGLNCGTARTMARQMRRELDDARVTDTLSWSEREGEILALAREARSRVRELPLLCERLSLPE